MNTIDDNWVDAGSAGNSVQAPSATKVQVFNNRSLARDLLLISVLGSAVHEAELTTEAALIYAAL